MDGSLLYSKPTDLNDNLIKNTFAATSKLVFDQTGRHQSPAKRTREIPITGLKTDHTL